MASRNPYEDPDLWRWAGGMEGLPEATTPEGVATPPDWSPIRRGTYDRFDLAGALAPGLLLALLLAFLGSLAADSLAMTLGLEKGPISPVLIAVVLGLAVRNGIGLPKVYEPGLRLCLQRILRIGVALLGIRLSLATVGQIGASAAPLIVVTIASALLLVRWLGRAMGVPGRLATLIAVGTAICGNTAIMATGPAIRAKDEEISYAVGTITLFGMLALLAYPFLAHGLFGADPALAGMFLGTAIHDTAQVTGAGVIYEQQFGAPEALDGATVTKLLRNLFMVAVIPLVAMTAREEDAAPAERPRVQVVPFFVLGFVAMALVRTGGDAWLPASAATGWEMLVANTTALSSWCLVTAMGAAGLGTDLARVRAVGLRPLGVGFAAAAIVGGIAATGIALFGS
ncbi:MAG: putative sulfate exporter family transporter [Myxococcota bacterium]|nr:putative sulfate exporter family transporter [Myxococcota bacterium]